MSNDVQFATEKIAKIISLFYPTLSAELRSLSERRFLLCFEIRAKSLRMLNVKSPSFHGRTLE